MFKTMIMIYLPVIASLIMMALLVYIVPEKIGTLKYIWALGATPFEIIALIIAVPIFAKIVSETMARYPIKPSPPAQRMTP